MQSVGSIELTQPVVVRDLGDRLIHDSGVALVLSLERPLVLPFPTLIEPSHLLSLPSRWTQTMSSKRRPGTQTSAAGSPDARPLENRLTGAEGEYGEHAERAAGYRHLGAGPNRAVQLVDVIRWA